MARRLYVLWLTSTLLTACNLPVGALLSGPPGPKVLGTVKDMKGAEVRVGLIGSAKAGGKQREIVSTSAANGSFSLSLPAWPPTDLMEQPDETRSVVFTLRAYSDRNGNSVYDDGEPLCECASGRFRYFSSDGPSGAYRAGWNAMTEDGRYTQSFSAAYVL
ncbi:MAG: hypothetical protein VKP62_02855 [Candidatus Sericytochromatia bacterium]|nr:hypothetical protein [Candidatus Sericytochromatia bacterium]